MLICTYLCTGVLQRPRTLLNIPPEELWIAPPAYLRTPDKIRTVAGMGIPGFKDSDPPDGCPGGHGGSSRGGSGGGSGGGGGGSGGGSGGSGGGDGGGVAGGAGGHEALFTGPRGVSCLADGTVVLVDHGNRRIRHISPAIESAANGYDPAMNSNGRCPKHPFRGSCACANMSTKAIVSTFAGTGEFGGKDGTAASCTFSDPIATAARPDGAVFVLEEFSSGVRFVEGTYLIFLFLEGGGDTKL